MKHPALLARYRDLVAGAPLSVTAVRDPAEAWRLHVCDALTAAPLVASMAADCAVDVGSGGGSPGIPIAIECEIPVTLLESAAPKARFLTATVAALGLACPVVHARSEQLAGGAGRDAFSLALARALAPPPVAVELCLPLVRPGGHLVLWTGAADPALAAAAAEQLCGRLEEVIESGERRRLLVMRKLAPTPDRFPRPPGRARKRPLIPLGSTR